MDICKQLSEVEKRHLSVMGVRVGVENFYLGQSIGIDEQYISVKIFILALKL